MAQSKQNKGISFLGVIWKLLVFVFKAICVLLAVATPVLGVWVSSSLAAYLNGPIWATALVGLLFFPLLPLAWEGLGAWRRSRKKTPKERILTFGDRFILRTLFLNLAFLGALLAARPEAGFTALQARGDWMLEGVEAPWAESVRPWLFRTADQLEWVYLAARDNPYAEDNPDEDVVPDAPAGERGKAPPVPPPPGRDGDGATSRGDGGAPDTGRDGQRDGGRRPDGGDTPPDGGSGDGAPGADDRGAPDDGDQGTPGEPPVKGRTVWPASNELHPLVKSMPRSAEASPGSVAAYIKERISDPFDRARAVHDWVADRIVYDAPALKLPLIPQQDPATIFRNRKGVCAGYARLFREIGQAAGLEVVYVVGNSRDERGDIGGAGHAWNAVKLEGAWYLLDATWDAGHLENGAFVKQFSTRYFLAPPEVFGLNHFPDESAWQLRERPLTRGEFMRQPMLDPRFYIEGFRLVEPTRSQITVNDQVVIRVENPRRYFLLAAFSDVEAGGGSQRTRCEVRQGATIEAVCRFPRPGSWRVLLFSNRERYGQYRQAGQLMVNSR